jgi:hypothetical protein
MPYSGSPAEQRSKRRLVYKKNGDRHRATDRAWYAANRLKALKSAERCRFRTVYGVDLELKAQWLRAQNGQCTICKTETPGKKGWHFDADHTFDPPFLRGILCGRCNMALGLFHHHIPALKSAAQYLCERGQ